jgi:DNA-binding HxlR family transcriptional regulator
MPVRSAAPRRPAARVAKVAAKVAASAAARIAAPVAYDAFHEACPSRQLLDTLGDKWVTLVLVALADGARRHGELARQVAGVSQKMLTQTLRSLERDGLVSRTVTPSVPVRVDYALTALGRELQLQLRELKRWAEQHMAKVSEAQRAYDARAAALGA